MKNKRFLLPGKLGDVIQLDLADRGEVMKPTTPIALR